MRLRRDGSIESANTPTYDNAGRAEDNRMFRCMVTRVIYSDASDNITGNAENPRVLYDVVVLGGFESGQIISNCRLASHLGGNSDYYERVLRAASSDNSATRLSESDGDIVFVQFVSGHSGYPIIVALDRGITPEQASVTTSALGPRELWKYNGIERLVDREGNYTFIRRGGAVSEGLNNTFVPDEVEDVKAKVEPQKVMLTLQNGTTITVDGNTDKVNIVSSGGAKVEVDGAADKVSVLSAGGAKLEVDGSGDEVLSQTAGGATYRANAATIALGASGIELLQQISDSLDEISGFLNTASGHTHVGNLGFPTAPPNVASAYTSAASALDGVKSDIDSIKGSL